MPVAEIRFQIANVRYQTDRATELQEMLADKRNYRCITCVLTVGTAI
jgi:hypothetical protein